MSEHSPASTSQFSTIHPQPTALDQKRSTSAETLTREAGEQVAQAGAYLASKTQEFPLAAVLVAGLVGYGIGYLIHGASTEWRNRREIEETTEPRTLFMRPTDWSKSPPV